MAVPDIPSDCRDARLTRFWPADKKMDVLDLITLFRLSRWINYVKDKLRQNNIILANFNDLNVHVQEDPYIKGLMDERVILGKDNLNKLFPLKISSKVLDSFFGLFEDSDVYCS
jgi:hypothetical protein